MPWNEYLSTRIHFNPPDEATYSHFMYWSRESHAGTLRHTLTSITMFVIHISGLASLVIRPPPLDVLVPRHLSGGHGYS